MPLGVIWGGSLQKGRGSENERQLETFLIQTPANKNHKNRFPTPSQQQENCGDSFIPPVTDLGFFFFVFVSCRISILNSLKLAESINFVYKIL